MTVPVSLAVASSDHATERFSLHMDSFRGMAAMAVVLYHIRFRFFLDYAEIGPPSLVDKLFFTLTAFGHDAVMIFFVLSGYLIAGTVVRDLSAGRWSWGRYTFNRLTRLYVVLIPGLVLTVCWDLLGLAWFGQSPSYSGGMRTWINDYFNIRPFLTPGIFAGNAAFLQRITVPTLGSNVPLWSLSFEAAYYVMFPLGLLVFWPKSSAMRRACYAVVAVALATFCGRAVLERMPIWLIGAALWAVPTVRLPAIRWPWLWSAIIPTALVVFVAACHGEGPKAATGNSILVMDYVTGLATAIALHLLRKDPAGAPSAIWRWWAPRLASLSYTLYIVHFPLFVFIRATLDDRPLDVTAGTLLATVGLALLALVYAIVIWSVFEARTDKIRQGLRGVFTRRRATAA